MRTAAAAAGWLGHVPGVPGADVSEVAEKAGAMRRKITHVYWKWSQVRLKQLCPLARLQVLRAIALKGGNFADELRAILLVRRSLRTQARRARMIRAGRRKR